MSRVQGKTRLAGCALMAVSTMGCMAAPVERAPTTEPLSRAPVGAPVGVSRAVVLSAVADSARHAAEARTTTVRAANRRVSKVSSYARNVAKGSPLFDTARAHATHTMLQAFEVTARARRLGGPLTMPPFIRSKYSRKRRYFNGVATNAWLAADVEAAVSNHTSTSQIRRLSDVETRRLQEVYAKTSRRYDVPHDRDVCDPFHPLNPTIAFETPLYHLFVYSIVNGDRCDMGGLDESVRWHVYERLNSDAIIVNGPNGCGMGSDPTYLLQVTRSGKTLLVRTVTGVCQTSGGYYEHFYDLFAPPRTHSLLTDPPEVVSSQKYTVEGGLFMMPAIMNGRSAVYHWPVNGRYTPYERKRWNARGELVWSRTLAVRINGLEYLCKNAQDWGGGDWEDIGDRKKDCPTVRQTCRYDSKKNAISCSYKTLTRTKLELSDLDEDAMSTAYNQPEYTARDMLKSKKAVRKGGYAFGPGVLKRLKELAAMIND